MVCVLTSGFGIKGVLDFSLILSVITIVEIANLLHFILFYGSSGVISLLNKVPRPFQSVPKATSKKILQYEQILLLFIDI